MEDEIFKRKEVEDELLNSSCWLVFHSEDERRKENQIFADSMKCNQESLNHRVQNISTPAKRHPTETNNAEKHGESQKLQVCANQYPLWLRVNHCSYLVLTFFLPCTDGV